MQVQDQMPTPLSTPIGVHRGVVESSSAIQPVGRTSHDQSQLPSQAKPKYSILSDEDLARISTRFGPGQSFQGDYTSNAPDVGLSVAGEISGSVQLAENSIFLLLPSGAAAACSVKVSVAVIEGSFDGKLNASAIEIMPGARVSGELNYQEIRIHRGANVAASHKIFE